MVWQQRFASAFYEIDAGHAIAVGPDGDVWVAGSLATQAGDLANDDGWLGRFASDGTMRWIQAAALQGAGGGTDVLDGIAMAADGLPMLAGTFFADDMDVHGWMGRTDDLGTPTMGIAFDAAGGWGTHAYDITTDAVGNVFVCGRATTGGGSITAFVSKYDLAGTAQWTVSRAGDANQSGDSFNAAWAVASDLAGGVFAVGYQSSLSHGDDMWIARYDGAGNELWSRVRDGVAGRSDEWTDVAAHPAGGVVVTGVEEGSSYLMGVVRRYDDLGGELWTDNYAGANKQGARFEGVSADDAGAIVVVGFTNTDDGRKAVVRRYDGDGVVVWSTVVDGANAAEAVATGEGGRIYVTGSSFAEATWDDIWIARFAP